MLGGFRSVLTCATLFVVGCADASPVEDVQEHRQGWAAQGMRVYVFVLDHTCWCPAAEADRIVVVDGEVESVELAISGLPSSWEGTTLDGLFDQALKAATKWPDGFTAEYDERYAFISSFTVDRGGED